MNKDNEKLNAEIVRLYKMGYTYKQIALKLDLSLGSIGSRIERMRKKGVVIKKWWQ